MSNNNQLDIPIQIVKMMLDSLKNKGGKVYFHVDDKRTIIVKRIEDKR